MGVPVILMGRSGTGKSYSMRDWPELGIINVLGKPLPFKGGGKTFQTTNYGAVKKALSVSKAKSIAIDDCGYLMTDMFMKGHSEGKSGSSVYDLYNEIGDSFYGLIRSIQTELPADKIVYLVMHEETDEFNGTQIKTIGKLLSEKVCIEGMVSIVIRAVCRQGKYLFLTNGEGIVKSPPGMLPEEMDNDLKQVDAAIRAYWEI